MAKLSQLTIPVKNPSTGAVTPQTFDLAGSGGGGSDTNYIGTKTDYDALPSSEKAKYDSMDFTDYHDGLNIDPTPMINSKNPVASGGVYAALQNVNSEIENLEEGVTNATELVAPLEQTLVATRSYSVGDQFVYNGFLYKVTVAIPFDSAIVIGTNCELAPNVVEQISAIKQKLTDVVLWQNPSPSAEFVAQKITLDLTAYQKVCICFSGDEELLIHRGYSGDAKSWQLYNSRFLTHHRTASVGDTGVTFGDCYRIQQTSSGSVFSETAFNRALIPLCIIGMY